MARLKTQKDYYQLSKQKKDKMKPVIRFSTIFLLFIFNIFQINAEVFRIHKTIVITMPETGNAICQAGINDALSIELPEDTTFLQGIEIEIKIPEIIARYRDSIAYSLYTGISPTPASNIIDYSGKREMIDTLPERLSMNISIPLTENHNIKQSPYTHITPYVYTDIVKNIFFRFQLVMKGIPESFDKELFDITIKPIYIDKGRLVLDLKYPVNQQLETIEKPYTIFIDEIPTNLNDSNTILDTGIHHISIVSDFYRNETRIFTIEQAQSTLLEIQLRDIAPTLQFLIPAGTQIFLDDNLIENGEIPFIVSQGEHIIRCVIGDYEVIKSIQVINGRSYIVNLKFEMDILENQ